MHINRFLNLINLKVGVPILRGVEQWCQWILFNIIDATTGVSNNCSFRSMFYCYLCGLTYFTDNTIADISLIRLNLDYSA